MSDKALEVLVSAVICATVVAVIIFAFIYKKVEIVIVEDRWWASTTSVKYDRTTLEMQCTPERVCTGFGDTESCHYKQDCHLESVTRTYTRCSNDLTGHDLPVIYPPPACSQQYGDYIRKYVRFRTRYHIEDTPGGKESGFIESLWSCLLPGSRRQITKNILGMICVCEENQ